MSAACPTEFDSARLQRLVEACDSAVSNQEKGDAMQELAEYVLGTCDMFSMAAFTELAPDQGHEDDIIYLNRRGPGALGGYFLVECRNRQTGFSSADVATLGAKVEEKGSSCGVVFSRKPITGNVDPPTAGNAMVRFFRHKRILIICITMAEASELRNCDDLLSLIERKFTDLILM